MMENREADLCIYAGGEDHNFEWIPLYRDQLLAIFPKDHPLAKKAEIPLDALMAEQFILPLASYDHEVHHILKKLPQYPHIRFTACTDYAIISMVTVGLGVSILPELLLRILLPARVLPAACRRRTAAPAPESKSGSA